MTTQSNGENLLVQGRIVWVNGSLFEGQTKTDFNTKQPIMGQDGQPKKEYGFGLAIPKVDPQTGQQTEEFQKVWNALHQQAFTLYPNGQIPPGFAMKYKDGDGVDHNGKPFADREGYKGHIVLACTTQIPIKFFRFEGGNNILVNDGIKCGDYVNVQLNVKAHPAKGQGKAGLYLNPSAVQLIQPGKEIVNAPSGDAIFGQAAPAYNGQVEAPTQPQMPAQGQPPMPGQTPAPQPQQAPQQPAPQPAPQQPAPQPGQVPGANPHYGVIPDNLQPGQAPQGNAPVPPVGQGTPSQNPSTQQNVNAGFAQAASPSNTQQAPTPQMPPMPGQGQ